MKLTQLQNIQADMSLVDQYMMEFLPPDQEQGKMREIISAVMSAKGKRYRPLLLLLAGQCGPNYKESREMLCKLGAIIELVHMASLIHDDIVDDSPLRRGQATIQHQFGKDMAVYTGDMILGRVMGILFREQFAEAGCILGSTMEDMCRGEIGQFDSRFRLDGTVENYIRNIHGKTVALFSAACRIGGMMSGGDQDVVDTLADFGEHLGYLFQIRDDLLDFVSDEAQEGKPIHMDFREGVFTLPVLYTIANPDFRMEMAALAKRAEKGQLSAYDTDRLDRAVRLSGGLDATTDQMEYHRREAIRLLDELPNQEVALTMRKLLSKLDLPSIEKPHTPLSVIGRAV